MYNDMIKNLKANQLEEDVVCEIINVAIDKAHNLGHELLDKYDVNDDAISMDGDEAFQAIFVNMMLQLMEFHQCTENLNMLTIIGARKALDEMGYDDEDIEEMEEDEIAPFVESYLDIQHKFSDLSNNQLRDLLFEVAKNILTEEELLDIL